MILVNFLRTKFSYTGQPNFSQFCHKTHDASVARKGNNIRFNFEISTHIKNKKALVHQRHLLNILIKFRGQTFVVGDLLAALKLTVG